MPVLIRNIYEASTMHALIKTGGKQYRVAKDDYLKVEKLAVDEGQDHEFNEVLMLCDGDKSTVGAPFVENAKVIAEVLEHNRHKKIRIVKFNLFV